MTETMQINAKGQASVPHLKRVLGFIICFSIWINFPLPAKIMGGIWFAAGIIYLIIRIRFAKDKSINIDFTEV
jgi:hypothetical protein